MQDNKRIIALDVLRGFALLGILLMNIQSFSMPGSAYLNPTAFGDFSGINKVIWAVVHTFADQKFMTIFSMLFGAGVLLFCERATESGKSVGKLHYARMFWLLVFGLLHGYLFWYGDILYAYAMSGFLIFLFRNLSVRALLIWATVLLILSSLYNLFVGISLPHMPAESLREIQAVWQPSDDYLTREIGAYTGSFMQALAFRADETAFMQTFVFLTMILWRVLAMMLIGMALFKSGFFHLRWQSKSYRNLLVISLLLGLALVLTGLQSHFSNSFSLEYSMFIGSQFNFWGSIFVALAYACIVLLLVKHELFKNIQVRLAAIGKTAFSNYILHTLVFTTVFYGYGLGMFASVERWGLMLMVVVVWIIQLWLSPLWLKRYAFGPLEWLWRTLTYGKVWSIRAKTLQSN